MKPIHLQVLISLVCLSVLSCCTIEKRHYRNGYYVKKASPNRSLTLNTGEKRPKEKKASQENKRIQTTSPALTAYEAANTWASADTKALPKTKPSDAKSCDSLLLKDGSVIEVKIKEIGTKDIRYKLCDFQEGPDYLVEKFKVSSIRYSNGRRELFNESTPPQVQNRTNDTAAPKGIEKSTNASLALSFGILGIYPMVFIGSIIGIIFGVIAMNEFNKSPGRYSNEKMGKVGLGLSIGGIILWVMLIFIFLL